MKIDELTRSLHRRYLASLNLFRFIQSVEFQTVYERANKDEIIVVRKWIESVDQTKLTMWTKDKLKELKMYEMLDVRCLRDIAQDKGISNYSVMSRLELISKISNHRGNGNANQDQRDTRSNEGTVGEVRQGS